MNTESSPIAQFLAERVSASIYSHGEIALLCGTSDTGQLNDIIGGRRKLPLGMVKALAKALDCNERQLMAMALRDWFGDEVFVQIAQCFQAGEGNTIEGIWIAALRELHGGVLPEMTAGRRRRLRLLAGFKA